MTRDSPTKLSKNDQIKRSKKQEEINKKKKRVIHSDSDSDGSTENDEMDMNEFRKYIQQIFPSKHLSNKIKAGDKLKKVLDDESEEEMKPKKNSTKKHKKIVESSEEEEIKPKKNSNKNQNKRQNKKKAVESSSEDEVEWETASDDSDDKYKKNSKKSKQNKKHKKKVETDSESDEDVSLGDEDTEEDSEDEDYEEEDSEEEVVKKGSKKLNIVFTIGGMDEDEDEEEWETEDDYDSDYDDYEDPDEVTEDEDESVSSASSDEEEDLPKKKNSKKSPKKKSDTKKDSKKGKNKKDDEDTDTDVKKKPTDVKKPADEKTTEEILAQMKELLAKNPNDKSIEKCIVFYERNIKKENAKREKKEKKHKAKNLRIFRKIFRDKNTMNDFAFYEKLDIDGQKKIIKELKEINKITRIQKPYRMTLLESEMPVQFKAAAMKKINSLKHMEPGSGDFYKIKNWVDTFMSIPFGKNKGLPITIDDGVEKCHDFMEVAQKTLDSAVYGLNDAKMQIMQMLGQLLTNPTAIGAAIAIHGPPGTGKTSLVKEGISKILNRPFTFIALGGATDSSFLEGHGYTYEGSTWGKIVQILIESKCMNPVIYFDELDKISDTPRGEEIAGILTHLTDTSQNSQFHDKYFAEINFDLSKCLFIFSYNDESKVNTILKDRMYRIKTTGYSPKDKIVISNNYLLPKIREQVRFKDGEIVIPDITLSYIIENHCNKEDGVRNLKRCLEIIYTKLNLYRLMKPNSNLFEKNMSLKVEFPFTVTKDIVDKLIKREDDSLASWRSLYL